jgi:hypothetical protein
MMTPHDGGCWYCHKNNPPLLFSCEFDTFVHEHCLRCAINGDPECQDREARIMAREFDMLEDDHA